MFQWSTIVRVVEVLIFVLVGSAAFLVLFPASHPYIAWIEPHGLKLTLSVFAMGLFFLMINHTRKMALSFAVCALLAVVLNTRSNVPFKPFTKTSGIQLSVAHFNTQSDKQIIDSILTSIKNTSPTLLSLHDIQEAQFDRIRKKLAKLGYKDFHCVTDEQRKCHMAVFSKFAFDYLEETELEGLPQIKGRIVLGPLRKVNFVSLNLPKVNGKMNVSKEEVVALLDDPTFVDTDPFLVFGHCNEVSWSKNLAKFRRLTGLNLYRREVISSAPHGFIPVAALPYDHILYSDHFSCKSFKAVSSQTDPAMGIIGTYQLRGNDQEKNNKSS